MKTPFYVDAEKLTSIDTAVSDNLRIILFCITCVIITFVGVTYLQAIEAVWLKALIAVILIALPLEIFLHAKKNIERFGDELLQSLYQKHIAQNALFGILLLMSFYLFAHIEPRVKNWDNSILLLLPYFIIYGTYRSVRTTMKKL